MIRLSGVLLLTLFSLCALAPVSNAAPWAELRTDLPADPALIQGTLPNGLRYVIRRNAEPRDRVTLRLVVAAGALHERDDERGLAHFVEHMIFRGTRSHPGDSLVNALQRLGVGFGPDNTAFTHYDHTIYHLELPDTTAATLKQGLSTFYEYAAEATFDPALIERERGIIFSEKATRDTPGYRRNVAGLAFLWPDSLQARRPVIGVEETLRSVTREHFVAFYDAWYRPDRTAVVIVGDIDPDTARKLIEETFANFTARAPARDDPVNIIPATATSPDIKINLDSAYVGIGLAFQHPRSSPDEPDTREHRTARLHRSLAFAMQQQRLNRIAAELGDALVAPSASVDDFIPGWEVASFSAAGRIDHWRELAAALEQEHRRAILHGFTPAELDLARRSFTELLETNIRSFPTRRSEHHAAEIVDLLLNGDAITTPEAIRDDLAAPLAAATLQACNRAFRSTWERSALHVFISANPAFKEDVRSIAQVLNESRQTPVTARTTAAAAPFAYTDFGPPGKLVHEETAAGLDVRLSRFANGVCLNFKQTDFEADTVNIFVRIRGGRLTTPSALPGLDLLAGYAFTDGGLGKHSAAEIGDLLTGHNVGLSFHLEPDAFVFTGRSSRRDLPLCLQLIAAYITDAGYRPEALRDAHASYGSLLSSLEASAGGPIRRYAERQLFHDDARFGIPGEQHFYNRTLPELEAWLRPALAEAPLEMSIVGDTTWDAASAAVSQTLGALPARAETAKPPRLKTPRFADPARQPVLYIAPARLKQSAIAWYFPAPDASDYRTERRCFLLASILEERVRHRLREELGSAYAPNAAFISYDALPKCSYFVVYAEVDTDRAPEAAAALRKEFDALRDKGITDDEFLRVKTPFLRERTDHLRSNGYWGHTVLLDAQERPYRLEAALNRHTDTSAITRAEVQSLLGKYISRKKGSLFIAEPGRLRKWDGK
ncbi:M16 family metallopeptidase [Nibricoccus aquaticus]|nr:insulinase family protein [Nibricoccus aquaticus]